MSFKDHKEFVENGDTIVLYMGRNQLASILIDVKKTYQNKFGAFPHSDFIGKKFGSKVYSKNRKGWVYMLHPSPELWTVTLPHRTQILYTTDISLITMELELKPGSIVVESGTGSGSLSHAIIRTIKPNGHLYTYDFHEQRVQKAREEMTAHGIGEFVTCNHADACKDGFTIENKADAVFLDLPAPWEAVPHAKKALKISGGRICSFSPCIEQVQRTCDALRKNRFFEIKTVECLLKPLIVRTVPFPEANLGDAEISEKSDRNHDSKNVEPEIKKTKVDSNENKNENEAVDKETVSKSEPENSTEESCNRNEQCEGEQKEPQNQNVSENSNNSTENGLQVKSNQKATSVDGQNEISGVDSRGVVTKFIATAKKGNINVLTSKSNKDMPGHTGYLTFASLYPEWKIASEE